MIRAVWENDVLEPVTLIIGKQELNLTEVEARQLLNDLAWALSCHDAGCGIRQCLCGGWPRLRQTSPDDWDIKCFCCGRRLASGARNAHEAAMEWNKGGWRYDL